MLDNQGNFQGHECKYNSSSPLYAFDFTPIDGECADMSTVYKMSFKGGAYSSINEPNEPP